MTTATISDMQEAERIVRHAIPRDIPDATIAYGGDEHDPFGHLRFDGQAVAELGDEISHEHAELIVGVLSGVRSLTSAIAEALAARSNREREVLTSIRDDISRATSYQDAVSRIDRRIEERLAELTNGMTGEHR